MELRLLAARSELGYTDVIALSLRDEPEAVSAHEQRELTQRAARAIAEREQQEWLALRARIDEAFAELRAARWSAGVRADVRVLERQIDRIGQRLPW